MTDHVDVAIIGGGLIGCSTALELRRAGRSVAVIERDLCGTRSSGVNYGGVRRQGRPAPQLRLAMRAHEIWQDLPARIGCDGGYRATGHLKLARTAEGMAQLEAYADFARTMGLDLDLLDAGQLHRRFPGLPEGLAGGSLSPADGQANPRLVAQGYASAARAAGALVLEQAEVLDIQPGPDFYLRCADGRELRAGAAVNAAGAWGAALARQLGDPVPMQIACPVMIVTEPMRPTIPINLGIEGGTIYMRQSERGNCIIGGGRGHLLDDRRSRPGTSGLAATATRAAALLPALAQAQVLRSWTGIEGYTPDKNPIICESPRHPGLFHAFGFSGGGFQIALAVGEHLAGLVLGRSDTTPFPEFSMARFPSSADKVAE